MKRVEGRINVFSLRGAGCRTSSHRGTLEPVDLRHHLHDADREPAIGWTLFVNPISKAHGWSIAAIQFAFAIFIALETWLTPIEGWIVDILGPRNGPRLMVAFGGITVALGWVINSMAESLTMLYAGAVISGIGGGAI